MHFFRSFSIDKTSEVPIYKQLSDCFFNMIEDGTLAPESRLPPIRRVAEGLKINSSTVTAAYRHLESKKAVYTKTGSGTYVLPRFSYVRETPCAEPSSLPEDIINFADASLPESFFPMSGLEYSFCEVLRREKSRAFVSGGRADDKTLEKELCKILGRYGISASEDTVRLVSGTRAAYLKKGETVLKQRGEELNYTGAFLEAGMNIVEADIGDISGLEGIIKAHRPGILYLSAYFSVPEGRSLSPTVKRRLPELAEKYDFYILEEDTAYDFYYSGAETVPIKALDAHGRVIYLKSLAKTLAPGITFAVFPERLAGMEISKTVPPILRKAACLYLKTGDYAGHVERARRYAREKYMLITGLFDKYLSEKAEWRLPEGGFGLWLDVKKDSQSFAQELLLQKTAVAPAGKFFENAEKNTYAYLRFVNRTEAEIKEGVRRIAGLLSRD